MPDQHQEQFSNLTKRSDALRASLSVLALRQAEAQQTVAAVLAKHGCTSVQQFEQLVATKKAEFDTASVALEKQLEEGEKRVAEIESALKS